MCQVGPSDVMWVDEPVACPWASRRGSGRCGRQCCAGLQRGHRRFPREAVCCARVVGYGGPAAQPGSASGAGARLVLREAERGAGHSRLWWRSAAPTRSCASGASRPSDPPRLRGPSRSPERERHARHARWAGRGRHSRHAAARSRTWPSLADTGASPGAAAPAAHPAPRRRVRRGGSPALPRPPQPAVRGRQRRVPRPASAAPVGVVDRDREMRAPAAVGIAGAAAAAAVVGVLLVSSSESDSEQQDASAPSTVRRPQDCPVTVPNGSTPPGERRSAEHHGNGKLWAALDREGRFVVAPESEYLAPGGAVDGILGPDGSVGIKAPWWRGPGVRGRSRIQARRLDAPAARVDRTIPPAGYGLTGFQATGLSLPSVGCWKVTGSVGRARLTYVTRVDTAPRQ
jgi:hypothetical protein